MPATTITEWYNSRTGALATDMSGSDKLVTNWFQVGVGAKRAATFVWTSTGSPVGVCGIEGTNEPAAGVEPPSVGRAVKGDALDLTKLDADPTTYQPGGDDDEGRLPIAFESPNEFLRETYTPTSGGTGATLLVHRGG